MLRCLALFIFLLSFQGCFAQKKYTTERNAKGKLLTTYQRGMRMSFNGQFDHAINDMEKAIKMAPDFIDAHIEWANVKNQQGKFAEAEIGYERALAIDPNYEPGVMYSLAIVEFDQKKFAEASSHFEQYLQQEKISEKRKDRAEQYLANASFAAEAMANPVPFRPKNMGPNINTAESEYLPTLTADGEKLIYTAVRQRQEDFYLAKKVDGEWQPGKAIASVNSQYNEGAQSITADGKLLVFTICDRPGGLGRCDLYFAEFRNDSWTKVRNMGEPVNSPAYESLPSLSADGQTLYFTSDRRGGQGQLDIWVSRRQADGKWSKPQNLGAPVNTPQHEQAPFIHPDGQTLYFMSQGHPGMGKYDLYFSRLQPDGTWGEPENLGYPINTEGNEGAFSVSLDGSTAYFSSDMEGGFGKTDIYTFDLYPAARPQPVTFVKATVTDASTGRPLVSNVEFIDLATGQIHAASVTDSDGEFMVTLPAGKDYALSVSKEKYLFHSENFALKDTGTLEEPYLLEIALTPIPVSGVAENTKPVILKNVFFETGSAALKDESRTELNRLKSLLDDNPALKIQINGHTDDVGSDADNLQLSEARAKAVFDYLVANGIGSERLRFKGFGETKPLVPNDSDANRQLNRRTEFVIFQ